MLEILDRNDLAKQISGYAFRKNDRQNFPSWEKLKKAFVSGDRAERDGHCPQGSYVRSAIDLARLEHANGATPQRIREILHDAVEVFAPVIPLFDYSPFQTRFAVLKAQAKKFQGGEIPHDHNQVFLAPGPNLGPNYETVTVNVKRQPAQFEMHDALIAALIAWDFGAARSMANDYHLQPAVKGAGPNHFAVLREAILGHTDGALAFLENIPDGYASDYPPARRELAEGVIRRDAKLVKEGLKATSTRFKTAWKLKTYCTAAKLRRYGSATAMLPDIYSHLVGMRWTMGDWAIAWMSLAWHRGMKEAFDEPSLFSEWVPWELCCPEPNPQGSNTIIAKAKMSKSKGLSKTEMKEQLFVLAKAGLTKQIEELVAQGVKLDSYNADRQTALMLATHSNQVATVDALLKAGAHIEPLDPRGRTALGIAAELGCREIVKTILSFGIKPDLTDHPVQPLIRACRKGDMEIVQMLIDAGADPNRISAYKNSGPLVDALKTKHYNVVRFLIKAGANPNTPVEDQRRALHYAAMNDECEMIEFLLKSGAEVNAEDYWGYSSLCVAAAAGAEKAVPILIAAGANVNQQNRDGTTPLMAAVEHPACVKLLITAGANASLCNKKKQTVFQLAEKHPETLELLSKYRKPH